MPAIVSGYHRGWRTGTKPAEFLYWLVQTNLFLAGLDEAGEWCRYHRLFQELLQHRMKALLSEGEIGNLHWRAGHWLAQQGYYDEALDHFLIAGDPLAAVYLVEQNYQPLINQEEWPVVW